MDNKKSPEGLQRQSKDKGKSSQLQIIFNYLFENRATASMVADATGIYQKNVTRYKRKLEKAGRLWELYKDNCKKTGYKAWFLTCDPDKVPNISKQLNLF